MVELVASRFALRVCQTALVFKALLNSRCDLKRAGRPERALDAGIQMSSAGQQRLEMLRSFYRILAGHLRTS
jgi:hypothetical protein